MKKYLAVFILPAFLIAGCESEQASQPQNSVTTSTAEQSTQAAEDNSETATDSISAETSKDTTDSTTVSTTMAQADTAQASQQDPRSGEAVYQQFCSTCHKTGVANAPKFADKAAWEPRIAKGKDVLYQSAINGVAGTAMTPKGSCMNCSDDELKAAVDYMVENAQ
jgi:cytochrome c5